MLDEKPRSYFEIPYTDKKTSSSGSSSNINTGWIKDSKGWRFRNSDGTLAQGTTVTDADGGKAQVVLLATYMQGFK